MTFPPKPFYFIRHGQTDWNLGKITTGKTEVPLNNTGVSQAKEVGRLLKIVEAEIGDGGCRLYTSPLCRARQTTDIINQEIKAEVVVILELQERGWGSLEGKTELEPTRRAIGVETSLAFDSRVAEALNNVISSCDSATPVIVSHGDVFAAIVKQVGLSYLRSDNCELFFFYPEPGSSSQWAVINYSNNYWV